MSYRLPNPTQINPRTFLALNQIPYKPSIINIPLLPHHEQHREALFTTAIVPQRRSYLLAGGAEPGLIEEDVVRPPVASFTPNMWADSFTSFPLDDEVQLKYAESIEALKQEVRSMLMAEGRKRAKKLVLTDTLERLGIGYHFQQEIEDQLQQIFQSSNSSTDEDDHEVPDDDDLFITSLQFRLLRQHRHYVPCSVFDKFIKVEGDKKKFKESLDGDAKGLLSLYEAAHLQTTDQGEDILEEAVAFTTHHLKRLLLEEKLDPSSSLQYQVSRALDQPLHRGVERVETRYYISSYEKDHDTRNETLLKFAKLDFNYLQNIYKKELHQVSRWWNELDLISKLPYARDRVVESYLWGMTFHFEPQYSDARIAFAKTIQMIAIIDDTYDNYATIEEADLFTEAMQRWDINEIHGLPNNNMKTVYRFVLNLYDDYEREAAKQGKLFAVPYAKEKVKQLCRAYKKELKWIMGVQVPTFEEYLANTEVTSTLYVMVTGPFLGLYKHIASIDWVMTEPKMISAISIMGRYLDDMGSHERESKDGKKLSGVDFYMKQHGLSKKETIDKFEKLAEDEWKEVNEAWILRSTPNCDQDMAQEILNITRMSEISYDKNEDRYTTQTGFAAIIKDMFVDSIPTDIMY